MRLAKTVVDERENFVRNMFRANPSLTGLAAQRQIQDKFGVAMRPNRIYELRNEVQTEVEAQTVVEPVVTPNSVTA